jgi:hypothetical protein
VLFRGDTAIALSLGEYRESVDVGFLCSSQVGYRLLRSTVTHQSLVRIVGGDAIYSRDVRTDRYAIRVFLEIDGVPVRFEIVREGHLSLVGALDPALGVPVLSRTDLFATKLLANADSFLDEAAYGRDIIDLAMMSSRWGPIPDAAFAKARQAYGSGVDAALEKAARRCPTPADFPLAWRGWASARGWPARSARPLRISCLAAWNPTRCQVTVKQVTVKRTGRDGPWPQMKIKKSLARHRLADHRIFLGRHPVPPQ